MTDYQQLLARKRFVHGDCGIETSTPIHPFLFPFQQDITRWALKKGRAAIFADTGMGKTFMQVEWARLIGGKCLIVAPLSVARQTVREALKIGVAVHYCRHEADTIDGINITNYEMIEKFDPATYRAIVLDESSILKSLDGKTKAKMIAMFRDTPYRLCCTATPAPNDIAELANHAEFLSIMTRADMLATFFVHDDKGWRLRGHATEPFYRWLASWAMTIKKPSDLGYSDEGFDLPPLSIIPVIERVDYAPDGQLFFTGLKGIVSRASIRKATIDDRVRAATELIQNGDQYLVWCGLNDEAAIISKAIPGSVNVQGSDDMETKMAAFDGFQNGEIKVLVTKPKIAGHGLNMQCCNKMIFLGLSDSYESYYQCIRRCYRYRQTKPVDVYIVLSDHEQEIYQNVLNKEKEAATMAENLISHVREYEKEELFDTVHRFNYSEDKMEHDEYTVMLGDSCERMKEIPDNSVDLSVFSPPFMSLYTYTPTERDIGNSREEGLFFEHFGVVISELLRVTKPGRNACVHVSQIPAMLVRDGYIGLKDFRGKVIDAFESRGWTYHGEVCIDKDPQAQAIRTHSKGLLFVQLKKDASWLRPALADYILVFRKPGDNGAAITPDLTNDEWIEYARPIWYGIKESDTLNVREAREESDDRHICPLQLGTIERCIRLWSNKGDTVLDPFAGICSTGYEALLLGRRFIGIELKESYYRAGIKNMARAVAKLNEGRLL